MKKVLYLLVLFLISCSTQPQVTVTSEVTITLPPPTATETLAPPTYTATSAAETVTIGGVTMTVGEDGVVDLDSMKATGSSDEVKAENLAKVDPTKWGYKVGEAQIRVDGPNRFMEKIVGEEVFRVATWDFSSNQWLWDGTMMEHIPLFDGFAKTYPVLDSGDVQVTKEVRADAAEIRAFAIGYTIYLYDGTDKTEAIIATFSGDDRGNNKLDPNAMLKSRKGQVVTGMIGFKTQSGKIVKMKFKDIEVFIRGFN
jgi:hypothetical protein